MPDSASITWQQRDAGRAPAAIRNGQESKWSATMGELLRAARSVTLISRAGAEVLLGQLQSVHGSTWTGSVLKAAPGAEHIKLNTTVQFDENDVQGATI